MLEGGSTASGQEGDPPLTDSDDEENQGPSNDEEDEDQEAAEEMGMLRLEKSFSSEVKPQAKAKAAPQATSKVHAKQNSRP